MPRGRRTPPPQRAAATAQLLTGASAAEASATSGVALRTVERLKAEMAEMAELGGGKPTGWDYAALVGAYLGECLQTLTRQVRVCGDPDWIAAQPARELAILHGVMADKALALLAAWQPSTAAPELPVIDGTIEHAA